MLVRDWMVSHVVTVTPETKLGPALGVMNERKIRRLPVVEGDKLAGIITKSDIYAAMGPLLKQAQAAAEEKSVGSFMTRNPVTVAPGDTLEHAAQTMLEQRISGLPVVDKKKLAGIITETDVFRAFCEIMGIREAGARIALRFEYGNNLLEKIQKKIGRMTLRSLVTYHDKASNDWVAVVRVRGRE